MKRLFLIALLCVISYGIIYSQSKVEVKTEIIKGEKIEYCLNDYLMLRITLSNVDCDSITEHHSFFKNIKLLTMTPWKKIGNDKFQLDVGIEISDNFEGNDAYIFLYDVNGKYRNVNKLVFVLSKQETYQTLK